jgi:GNAT superfamily N-acetyltransferase
MNVEIRPLSSDLLGDYFTLFDGVKFCDHPDWSACYCYSFHFTGTSEQWNKESNKTSVEKLVKSGQMKGYLAYHEKNPIGWCNTNNRLNYQRLHKLYDLVDPGNETICSIVCFLIHQDYRRKGVARKLLERIISDYSNAGYTMIEAYSEISDLTSEGQYKGPMALYMDLGFEAVKTFETYTLVRKFL